MENSREFPTNIKFQIMELELPVMSLECFLCQKYTKVCILLKVLAVKEEFKEKTFYSKITAFKISKLYFQKILNLYGNGNFQEIRRNSRKYFRF